MARTLNADLLTAQTSGYPAGSYSPSIRCQITDGTTTYDYTFDPTVNTNRLLHVTESPSLWDDQGVIMLNNSDRGVPSDLRGYYVDVGWGHNTVSGIRNSAADGAVCPRMWVMQQEDMSGGEKHGPKKIYTVLKMAGIWRAVLFAQPLKLGTSPYYRDDRNDPNGGSNTIAVLTDKTIYGIIEYLIETSLTAQVNKTFTLSALGTQDDGLINSIIPFPTGGGGTMTLNLDTPGKFDTYGAFIQDLLAQTKCFLRAKANLDFEVIYPQAADAVNETYYSLAATGHPFYEIEDVKVGQQQNGNGLPNHVEVFGSSNLTLVAPSGHDDILGEWYDSDHWTTVNDGSLVVGTVYRIYTISGSDFTTVGAGANTIGTIFTATGTSAGGTGTCKTYTGPFMPVDKTYQQPGMETIAQCANEATVLGRLLKDQLTGCRIVIPMDARVELYDRIEVQDQRGH